MSLADKYFIENCRDIIEHGSWDTNSEVRPRWEDGTPAHTVKKFCVVNRYNLQEEFPVMTLRRIYYRSAIEEILWIYQKKSNRVADLSTHIWDSWADENGTIGKAYGWQLGQKSIYPEGEFDQVDRVLYDLSHNPASRRIMTNMYNHKDLHEMGLAPCLQYDLQRDGRYAERYSQSAFTGYAYCEQLERVPVCRTSDNVRKSVGT